MKVTPGLEQLLRECAARGCVDAPEKKIPLVAVPMANNEEIIRCIAAVSRDGIAEFLLIGNQEQFERTAARCGVSVKGARFAAEEDPVAACALAARLASAGEVDILMKGLVQTADFTRAILNREHGLVDPGRLISHVAVFEVPRYHKLLLLSDAAINVAPGIEQKIEILCNAVGVARSLGIVKPKIACVAPVEKESPRIQSTVDATAIVRKYRDGELTERLGEVEIAGPLGFDLAVSTEAAEIKCIADPVAGEADIVLMPNLEAGNALYKSLTVFAGAKVAGVIAGARVPVVLTSRADSEQSKELSVLLAIAGTSMPGRANRPGTT